MADKLVAFPKLNNSNYDNWSFRMKLLLTKEGNWKAVADAKPNPVTDAWKAKDEQALATIGLAVEDGQLIHLRKAKSAAEAWTNLESFHVKKTLTSKVSVMRRICSLRLERHGNMEVHVSKMAELFEKLNTLQPEKILDDQWLVAILFSSLPEEYETLVTALEARPEEDLTVDMVKGKLIDEWLKKKQRNEGDDDLEGAHYVDSKAGPGKCFFCKRTGHQKANCEKFKAWRAEKGNKPASKQHKANHVKQANDDDDDAGNYAFLTGDSSETAQQWILDSGATCHIANYRKFFDHLDEAVHEDVWVANGAKARSKGRGSGRIGVVDGAGRKRDVPVEGVLYVPEMKSNLLSVKRLVQKGFVVTFDASGAKILRGEKVCAVVESAGNLFVLRQTDESVSMATTSNECIHTWHRRLGHRDCEAIVKLQDLTDGMKLRSCKCTEECEVCIQGKMQRKPFPKVSTSESSEVMDLVHTDICGPMRTKTFGGRRYFITFIDDHSKYTVVYLLRAKSEAIEKLEEYVQLMKTQFGKVPKILRSDRGGEYTGKKVKAFLKRHGVIGQFTAPYTPQQNGTAERKNRYLVEMARCMLIDANLDNRFWGEAIVTANYLQNRLPSRRIDGTPYERWFGKKPSLGHMQRFGVDAYCHVPSEKRGKLDQKAIKLKFVGYSEVSKAYRLLDVATGKVTISRDVKFLATCRSEPELVEQDLVYPLIDFQRVEPEVPDDEVEVDPDNDDDDLEYESLPEDTDEEIVEPLVDEEQTTRRSTRVNIGRAPDRYACTAETTIQEEPKTLKQAFASPHRVEWKKAMEEELGSIEANETWDLVELPAGRRAIGCKWVYKLKRNENGVIVRYKARLVAQGFSQQFGTDYDQVFAPVVRQTTFRTLLSVAAKRNMAVKQFDVKTAFLNGNLEEEIYMKQPPGYVVNGMESKVCRLKKSLYGLKQAARSWNQRLNEVLVENGFQRCEADPCLYRKQIDGRWCYVLVYVDDLIVASEDERIITELERSLESNFEVSSLGDVRFYLGIEVNRDQTGDFHINQRKYIEEVVNSVGLQDAKVSAIPLDVGYGKTEEEDDLLPNNQQYQKVVGQLLYIAVNSRPDIAAAISIMSRKVSCPTQQDWNELKRIVRYLKGTKDLKLTLSSSSDRSGLTGYADADWAECRDDRKSNSGYVFKFCGGTISWACRKQTCVSLSTAEAEFVSLSEASQEAVWLQRLLEDLGEKAEAVTIFEDNQSCLKMLDSEKFSNRTKHISTKFHYAKDLKTNGTIKYVYCPTESMAADLLTKPVPRVRLEVLRKACGLH